jgi:hypothetical protein
MDEAAAKVAALSGLPGVSAECRNFATLYNCGNIFKQCETIPSTTGNFRDFFFVTKN